MQTSTIMLLVWNIMDLQLDLWNADSLLLRKADTCVGANSITAHIPYTKFRVWKISPIVRTLYCVKLFANFNTANRVHAPTGSSEPYTRWKFSLGKFSPMTCVGEIGENFHMAKISAYTLYKLTLTADTKNYMHSIARQSITSVLKLLISQLLTSIRLTDKVIDHITII